MCDVCKRLESFESVLTAQWSTGQWLVVAQAPNCRGLSYKTGSDYQVKSNYLVTRHLYAGDQLLYELNKRCLCA